MIGKGIIILSGLITLFIKLSVSQQGKLKMPSEDMPVIHPIEVEGKTFYVGTFFKANWYRAGEFCKIYGMELASIMNSGETDAILLAIKTYDFDNDTQFWTSGNDLSKFNSWKWASTGASFAFTYWGLNEPGTQATGKNCVLISGEKDWRWKTENCAVEFHFICEKKNGRTSSFSDPHF